MRVSSCVLLCLLSASLVTGIALQDVPNHNFGLVEKEQTATQYNDFIEADEPEMDVDVDVDEDTDEDVDEDEDTDEDVDADEDVDTDEDVDVDEDVDEDVDADEDVDEDTNEDVTLTESSSGRRLLRWKRFVPKPIRRIFAKPAPKPAPRPAPAPVVVKTVAPAPRPAPKPAPRPAPAPVVVKTVAPASKPAPKPAPRPAPAPVVVKSAPAPVVVKTVAPAPAPKKKKGGFLKKGFSVIKKVANKVADKVDDIPGAVKKTAKVAVKVAKAVAPIAVPALQLIPGANIPLTIIKTAAPKVTEAIIKVKKAVDKVKEAKAKVKAFASPKVKEAVKKAVKKAAPKVKEAVKKVVKNAAPKVKEAVKKVAPKVKEAVKKAAPKVKKAEKKAVKKAEKKAVKKAEKKAVEKTAKKVNGAVKKVKDAVKKAAPKLKDAVKKADKKVKTFVKKAVPKVKALIPNISGVKIYGNYCGPNYCGGQKFQGAEGPKCQWGVAPKDSLDSCCKVHDKCCGTPETRGTQCNKEILSCVKSAKCDGAGCKLAKSAMSLTFSALKNNVCGELAKPSGPESKSKSNARPALIKKSPTVTVTVDTAAADAPAVDAADAPAVDAADAPVPAAADDATKESEVPVIENDRVVREIIESIPKSSASIDNIKGKLVSLMKQLDTDESKNANENSENVKQARESLQTEQTRIDKQRETLKNLYDETERLNATIQTHYNQMLDDAKYLKSLDDMRPGFLKSLSELASHIKNVKDIVDQRLIKDEYKDEMMTILSDLHFNTHNISGYLATVFMNHYNKYKNRVQSDNGNYSEDIKRLNSLAVEYKEQSEKLGKLEKEKARLEDILTRMKSTMTLSVSQREDFERMMKEVMVMFNALSRRCSTME